MKKFHSSFLIKYLSISLILILFAPATSFAACDSKLSSESLLNTYTTHDPLQCLQFNTASKLSFKDVPFSEAELYIDYLTKTTYTGNSTRRLAQGYPNGTFGMGKTLTRFELTKLALGSNCIDYLQNPQPNTIFTDVPTDNSEMSLVIGKAYNQGIIVGVGDKFYPQNQVTWGEAIKILLGGSIYFNREGVSVYQFPSSVSGVTDESFRQYVEFANEMGLIHGKHTSYINGHFVFDYSFPQNEFIKREEMAEVLSKQITWFKNIELPCI